MSSSSFEITITLGIGSILFLINAPFPKLTGGVYRIFLGLYWAFIEEGHLKESGKYGRKNGNMVIIEKIWYTDNQKLYDSAYSVRPIKDKHLQTEIALLTEKKR